MSQLRTPFRSPAPGRRRSGDRGAVMVLGVFAIFALIAATGLAVDIGRQRAERRDMQALSDVIALDMARLADGATLDEIFANDAHFELDRSAKRNALTPVGTDSTIDYTASLASGDGVHVDVVFGNFDRVAETFTAYGPGDGGLVPNAAQATSTNQVDFLLLPASGGPSGGGVSRSAVARYGSEDFAGFRVGSSLVSVNPASETIIGQILNNVTNGQLSLLGWNGLADADIGLDLLGQHLGVPLTAMSPQELADTTVSYNDLAVATAQALAQSDNDGDGQPDGNTAEVQLVDDFVDAEIQDAQVSLADVLGVDASNDGIPAVEGDVNVAQMLTSSAFLVTGEHFVEIPDTVLDLPGITHTQLRLTGIEAPQTVYGGDGASGTTSQVRLDITPTFDFDSTTVLQDACGLPDDEQGLINSLLSGVLDLLTCLLSTIDIDTGVAISGTAPIQLDIAEVTATQHIDCPNEQLGITTTPAIVDLLAAIDLEVAAVVNGTRTNPLIDVHVPAGAHTDGGPGDVSFTGTNPTTVAGGVEYTEFSPPTQQVGSNPVGLAGLIDLGTAHIELLDSISLDTLANWVIGLVEPALNQLLGEIDQYILTPLAELLGINLGGADLTPLLLRCGGYGVQLVG